MKFTRRKNYRIKTDPQVIGEYCYNLEQKKGGKLTPKECMRLQGVSDETTDKLIDAGISDTRLYFAAGDAVTVNVVYEVAKKMKAVMDARDAKENIAQTDAKR